MKLGLVGQYVVTAAVTWGIVAFINGSRAEPLNAGRAMMLTSTLLVVVNTAILMIMNVHRFLSPEAWGGVVVDVSVGGWLVTAIGWRRSHEFQKSRAEETGIGSA
ncbi:MAG: hypothetical protein AB1714_16475 [Acidobacteriota bacterium]